MNISQHTSRRAAGVLILSGAVLLGTIATAAAFNGRQAGPDVPVPSAPVATPSPSKAPIVTPAPVPSETPIETDAPTTPEPVPTPQPTETPDQTEVPEPTDGGGDAMPIKVDLENATGHDVYVDVVDYGGTLLDAESGKPGDGMSVEPYTLRVENIDARTLRLTWVDYAIDNALALYVYGTGDRIVLIQPEPTGAVDATGFDRELILTFDHDISAATVEAFLQDGMDTPGE